MAAQIKLTNVSKHERVLVLDNVVLPTDEAPDPPHEYPDRVLAPGESVTLYVTDTTAILALAADADGHSGTSIGRVQ
jgi:hypothetical protein